ncbi:MAG: LysM peptidoglycan-binding domain-containing protein, partial [Candidatus Daviesbacteria bacterium]|nr:LysM peptidoglycan-binding domain-containing protein [Candidatus Daviesbacteria bacterium]
MARKISITNTEKVSSDNKSYLERLENDMKSNQSKISMVLGVLIILVVGILIFNYFNRGKATLGPAQQTNQTDIQDVSPDKLPGKYTVKESDTLFTIAQNYYKDGYKFTEIAKANNITDPNQVETGQVLEIPKLETLKAAASPEPVTSPEETLGTGGSNITIWGPQISGNTYTVVEGD